MKLLTKIAYEKRIANAKAAAAAETSGNDTDIIVTPKEYLPHHTGENRPRTIDTENSAQLKPTPHIDSDDGTRTIATDNSIQLQPKTHIAKQVTRKRGAEKIALHSSMASPRMTQHLHDIAWHYISMVRAVLHSIAQYDTV